MYFIHRTNIEETCSKLLAKLSKQTSNSSAAGTFNPLWLLLRASIEKLTTLHLQMVHKVCELVKDVTKYTDELHKKHKNVSSISKYIILYKLIKYTFIIT